MRIIVFRIVFFLHFGYSANKLDDSANKLFYSANNFIYSANNATSPANKTKNRLEGSPLRAGFVILIPLRSLQGRH